MTVSAGCSWSPGVEFERRAVAEADATYASSVKSRMYSFAMFSAGLETIRPPREEEPK